MGCYYPALPVVCRPVPVAVPPADAAMAAAKVPEAVATPEDAMAGVTADAVGAGPSSTIATVGNTTVVRDSGHSNRVRC